MSATSLPAFFFYPSDWMTDLKVQSLDFEQQGIWFAILCVMHECDERGTLSESNQPMSRKTLAKLIGCDLRKLNRTMDELLAKKVAYTDENGIVYNKRMVKDHAIILARREAGSKGGNPKLLNQKNKTGLNTGKRLSSTDSNSGTNTITTTVCVQDLYQKSVNDEEWLFKTSSAHGIPTHAIQTFCNEWITNAELRFMLEEYPVNKLLSMMLEDLVKEKPKLIPKENKVPTEADSW